MSRSRRSRNSRKRNSSFFDTILQIDGKKVICILLILFLIFLLSFTYSKLLIASNSKKALSYDSQKVASISDEEKSSQNEVSMDEDYTDSNLLENRSDSSNTSSDSSSTSDSSRSFTLCAIGDVMCHNTQYWDAYVKSTGEYDFSYVFKDIVKYTMSPDITVGSLETSFAGADRGYSNYPTFNSPDNLAYSLRQIGVDVLSTAGNHCLDMGYSGLCRTIDVLDGYGISHLGTYKTQDEQKQILYNYVKGTKIAFVNYTYGTNGIPIPDGKEFCVNLINKDLIKTQLDTAKSEGADMIVACMHWGTEYRTTANSEQEELADFLFQNGVDVILGNHPHTLEPMEKRTVTLADGSTKDCFVIYALGNFICDQNYENTRNSIILNLRITHSSDNKISIDRVTYTPIHMYKNPNLSIQRFKVLDIEKAIDSYEDGSDTSIGKAKYDDLKVQLEKIKSIVGDEILE